MTRVSEKFATAVSKNIGGTQSVKNFVLFSPSALFARGLCFEKTARRDEYYVWRFLLPLFRPILEVVVLSYSQRMRLTPDGEQIVELNGDLDCKAEEFANLVVRSPEFREISGSPFGAENFLSTAVISQEFLTPISALDIAITRYLAGDRPACRSLLEELVSRKEPFLNLNEAQVIGRKILDWTEHDHSNLDRFIEECVSKNVARHFPGLRIAL